MNTMLIDTHCHLDAECFRQEIDDIIQRAAAQGVCHLITIGVSLDSSKAAVALAERYPSVSAVVGIHPNYVQEARASDWDGIVALSQHPEVVGIGETGMDRYWDHSPADLQEEYFRKHIDLSRASGKPFVVHCRDAEADVVRILQQSAEEHGPLTGVMHSFCGSAENAAACLQAGMHISFAGMLTYKKNETLRETARVIPLSRLLVETDSPYLAPQPNRGKRNEPAWVRWTAECLAAVHGLSLSQLAEQTTENARQLFKV